MSAADHHELNEAYLEIARHHSDFRRIAALIEEALSFDVSADYEEHGFTAAALKLVDTYGTALKRIQGICG